MRVSAPTGSGQAGNHGRAGGLEPDRMFATDTWRRQGEPILAAPPARGAVTAASARTTTGRRYSSSPVCRTDKNAFCGISTFPTSFMRFLPSFCFSHSLRLRLMSPP